MTDIDFSDYKTVGTFHGYHGTGLIPQVKMLFLHNQAYPATPVVGMPVFVRLNEEGEALLVRITSLTPDGDLAGSVGDEYVLRKIRQDGMPRIPSNIMETSFSYTVAGRPLGVVRRVDDTLQFVPSHRRVPPLGAPVIFAEGDLFHFAMNAAESDAGVPIGFAALGEFVWGDAANGLSQDNKAEWIVPQSPVTMPKFDIKQLVARRSFVLAKAGYGKSNVVKLLFSELYKDGPPVHTRQDGSTSPVGVLVGDLDGEYFWPSADVPGLADVDHLRDHLHVWTDRTAGDGYNSFRVGGVKIDIRKTPPGKILPLVLPKDRLSQPNVQAVMALTEAKWTELVDALVLAGHSMPDDDGLKDIAVTLGFVKNERADFGPVEKNMTMGSVRNVKAAILALHDPKSTLLDDVEEALRVGALCVIDLSLLRNRAQAMLGLMLGRIFERNMRANTEAGTTVTPVIAVIEEAQNVLGGREGEITRPFIEFTKEGRKFGCGILAITQQPGSIDDEIISQGDNFFAFHLLSKTDLKALGDANPHFSEDLLSSLLNEPLVGSGLFFSLHSKKQFPVAFRPFDFTKRYEANSLAESGPLDTAAFRMRNRSRERVAGRDPETAEVVRAVADALSRAAFPNKCKLGEGKRTHVQHKLREGAPFRIASQDNPEETSVWRQPSMKWAGQHVDTVLDLLYGEGRWTCSGDDVTAHGRMQRIPGADEYRTSLVEDKELTAESESAW